MHWGADVMNEQPANLEDLMQRYVDGDPRAFEALYTEIAPDLRRVLRRRLRAPHKVEDAMQKTFLNVHTARHRYRRGAPVRPWVLTIARNVAFDHLRKKSSSEQPLSHEVARRIEDPTDALGEREALRSLTRALDALPPDKREVIELHKIQGLPMAEVAERIGIKEGTARVRAHRGYKALKTMLAA